MHAPVRADRIGPAGRILREPLLHFLLIGAFLFALYDFVGGGAPSDRTISVDDKVAATLYAQFNKTWHRPPTANEMDALVESHVRDEIFYREGVLLGLDRDDPTIKRRVSQKFATIAEESETSKPPTDAELGRWMNEHSDRYAEPPLVTFDQIAFNPGDSQLAAIETAQKALVAGADPKALGDGRMMLPHFEIYPIDMVQRDFGPEFAQAILSVPAGRWVGPVKSGFGVHLVKVEKVVRGRLPKLDEVRAAVSRDHEQDRRTRSLEAAYRKLRQAYRIDYSGRWRPGQSQ